MRAEPHAGAASRARTGPSEPLRPTTPPTSQARRFGASAERRSLRRGVDRILRKRPYGRVEPGMGGRHALPWLSGFETRSIGFLWFQPVGTRAMATRLLRRFRPRAVQRSVAALPQTARPGDASRRPVGRLGISAAGSWPLVALLLLPAGASLATPVAQGLLDLHAARPGPRGAVAVQALSSLSGSFLEDRGQLRNREVRYYVASGSLRVGMVRDGLLLELVPSPGGALDSSAPWEAPPDREPPSPPPPGPAT